MHDDEDDYKPHDWNEDERPKLPGAASTPNHPPALRVAYFVVGLIVSLTGGLGNALVTANIVNLQGTLGAYASEMQWLTGAYVMTVVSMNLLLVKFRQQYGLRAFTLVFLVLYALVTFAHLFAHNLPTAIAVRAVSGMVGAALNVLGLYYTLQAFPQAHKPKGIVFGLGFSQLALPLARTFSSRLLAYGEWRGLIFFELGMALVALACVLALRLPPGDRIKAFEKVDFLTFALFAPGVALLCAVLVMGRVDWWLDAPWIAYALCGAVVLILAALALEAARARPLLNVRFLTSVRIVKLASAVLLTRIVLAESTGAVGFLQALGLHTDQMQTLFGVVLVGSAAGLVASALTVKPTNLTYSLMVALLFMAAGAWLDAGATSLTRPINMYLSQFLLAFGGTFFMGPTMMTGIKEVMLDPRNLVSFSVMFSITQNLGGILGSAITGTFQTVREKFHSSYLVEHLTLLDPQVAARIASSANGYAHQLADPTMRSAEGIAALGTAATREANVLAYNDEFMLIAAVAVATLLWLLISQIWLRLSQSGLPLAHSNPAPAQTHLTISESQ